MSESLWNKRHPITVSSVPQLLHNKKGHWNKWKGRKEYRDGFGVKIQSVGELKLGEMLYMESWIDPGSMLSTNQSLSISPLPPQMDRGEKIQSVVMIHPLFPLPASLLSFSLSLIRHPLLIFSWKVFLAQLSLRYLSSISAPCFLLLLPRLHP